jgi:hypothetical protein
MACIHKEIVIEAPPEHVWAAVRDIGAVHERLTPGILVDTHLDGDERVRTFVPRAKVHELIVALDDEQRRLAYAVVEGSKRTTYHHASMQVEASHLGEQEREPWQQEVIDQRPHRLRSMCSLLGM